jgi:hypothetical protein
MTKCEHEKTDIFKCSSLACEISECIKCFPTLGCRLCFREVKIHTCRQCIARSTHCTNCDSPLCNVHVLFDKELGPFCDSRRSNCLEQYRKSNYINVNFKLYGNVDEKIQPYLQNIIKEMFECDIRVCHLRISEYSEEKPHT